MTAALKIFSKTMPLFQETGLITIYVPVTSTMNPIAVKLRVNQRASGDTRSSGVTLPMALCARFYRYRISGILFLGAERLQMRNTAGAVLRGGHEDGLVLSKPS